MELDRLWRRRLAEKNPMAVPSDQYIKRVRKGETILWFGDALPALRKKPPHRIRWIAGIFAGLAALLCLFTFVIAEPDPSSPIIDQFERFLIFGFAIYSAYWTYLHFFGLPNWFARRAIMNHYMITDQRLIAFNRWRGISMELETIEKAELSEQPGEYAMTITQKPGKMTVIEERWDGLPDLSEAQRIIKEQIALHR